MLSGVRFGVISIKNNIIQQPQHQDRALPGEDNDGELDLLEPDLPPVVLYTLPDIILVSLVLVSPGLGVCVKSDTVHCQPVPN